VEDDTNALEPVANTVVEPEDAEQVDVALHRRVDGLEVDAARRGNIGEAAHQTGAQRVEQKLRGRRGVVGADEHRRVAASMTAGFRCSCS
jgi:hypothetical protein